jgi:hypothetical protein
MLVSVLFFGLPLLGHFAHRCIGDRADPFIQIWTLAWWPHALTSGENPIITQAVWAPAGYNLTRTVSMPAPGLILSPITMLFGPIVSYNVLCLICPALAAFSAFVLCRYLTTLFWPAIIAGYIFGFSEYVLAHLLGQVFLLFIFPVPLAIYLVLLRIDRRITRFVFLGLLVFVLLFEFFSSTELFATTAVFGAAALAMSWLVYRPTIGRNIVNVALEIGCAYAVTGLLAVPYLYRVFADGVPGQVWPSSAFSNDLLAFVLPSYVFYAGGPFRGIVYNFRSNSIETTAYLGPGVWIILVLYAESFWSTKAGKFLILSLIFLGVMSLGPVLHVNGIVRGRAPWCLLGWLPLVEEALPARFGLYFFLVAAVIVSLYLSQGSISQHSKILLAIISVLALAPDLGLFRSVITHIRIPQFFRSGQYRSYLAKNDNVLVLPYVEREDGLLWQAQTGFYFRLAAVRLTLPPAEATSWPALSTLETGDEILDFPEQFKAFLAAHGVKAIILDPSTGGPWQRLLKEARLAPRATGGVLFYEVTPAMLDQFRDATGRAMAKKQAELSFSVLLNAAREYLAAGFSLKTLDPWEAHRLRLLALPVDPGPIPADSHWWQNLWLGPWHNSMIGIGIEGDYDTLRPLVCKYGGYGTDVFFPFPKKLGTRPKESLGELLITFTPAELQQAANKTIATDQNRAERLATSASSRHR